MSHNRWRQPRMHLLLVMVVTLEATARASCDVTRIYESAAKLTRRLLQYATDVVLYR